MDAALLFFGFLWALLGGKTSTPETSPPPRQLPPAPSGGGPLVSTPPWPQVVPSGLPPFPGSGWEFDEPPPVAVQQRAQQLLSALWARGANTWKTEQTAGRWITYQAQIVASGKKGVVAYREKRRALPPPPAPSSSQQTAARPSTPPARQNPVASPPMGPPPPPATSRPPASSTSSPAPVAVPSPMSLPTLSYGMGLKPAAPVPEVVILQQRLQRAGFNLDADGRFGQGTRVAVIEFQRRTGLAPNQTNAQLQARGFGAVKTATWTKLFEERA